MIHGPRNTIRSFALVCVAITSVFVMWMSYFTVTTISSTDWCGKVVGSAKYTDGRPDFAISGCVQVMKDQIAALSSNSLIFGGVIALCLLALIVIVVAGGKLSFTGPGGFGGSVGKGGDDLTNPEQAAQHVVEGAQGAAEDVNAASQEDK